MKKKKKMIGSLTKPQQKGKKWEKNEKNADL